jgi:hypothetical protein
MDIVTLASQVTTLVAPFLPYLGKLAKKGGEKLAEAVAQKGGEAAFEAAKRFWAKITGGLPSEDQEELTGAATLVAASPNDSNRQAILADVLAMSLERSPQLAKELLEELTAARASDASVNEILVGNQARISRIVQEVHKGRNTMKAGDGVIITDVTQKSG